jgi:hypothetical protein
MTKLAAHDRTRALQLALGCLWLLDALLQIQSFMLGRGFAAMLRATAAGNPPVVAIPITWTAGIVGHHPVVADEIFAAVQLLIGLGIAWRPALRTALAASVAWSVAVWWLGEGLGGLLAGTASPVNGAPGPALLYALLAVLLWPGGPTRRIWPGRTSPRNAQQIWPGRTQPLRIRPVSLTPPNSARVCPRPSAVSGRPRAARVVWLLLWGGLAVLTVRPATSAPRALSGMIAAAAAGQPRWLAGLDDRIAIAVAGRGPVAAVVLSVLLGVIAAGIYWPRRAVPAILVVAMLTAGGIWVAQGLGGMLTGMGTDPASGPLLVLLALTCWPAQQPPEAAPEAATPTASARAAPAASQP